MLGGKMMSFKNLKLICLDNDDVISAVEQTPTYKRTREILASIGNQNVVEELQRPETPETQQGIISFV